MKKATYTIDRVVKGMVFIIDENVGLSITNDAENVVIELLAKYPNHRIIYCDTDGQWDELLHWNGQFTGFAPYNK